MIYLNSFLFCGTVCFISQLILDNTKLTPGHITSLFVVIGAFLDIFGIYDKFVLYCGVTSLRKLGKYKTLNSSSHLPPIKSGDPVPVYGIQFVEGACELPLQPPSQSLSKAPAS